LAKNDLARSQPKKAAELMKMLHVWQKEVSAQMMQAKQLEP
jgi:hypothetical protein